MVLDMGCGDGQISRMLAGRGAHVVGIDPTWNQLSVATERGGGPAYARAEAAAAAVPDASRSTPSSRASCSSTSTTSTRRSREVARVSRAGGRFSFFLNHPLLQTPGSGWIDDQMLDPPEQYWRIGPYLDEAETDEQVEHGVYIRFLHRPLSRYLNTLTDHGLVLERMIEPAPPPGFLALAPEYALAATIPRLLYLRLRRVDRR